MPASPEFLPPGLTPLQKLIIRANGGLPGTRLELDGLLGRQWSAAVLGAILRGVLTKPEQADRGTLLLAVMAAQTRRELPDKRFELLLTFEAHDWGLVTDTKCCAPGGGHYALDPYLHRVDPLEVALNRCALRPGIRELAEAVFKGVLPREAPGGEQEFVLVVDALLEELDVQTRGGTESMEQGTASDPASQQSLPSAGPSVAHPYRATSFRQPVPVEGRNELAVPGARAPASPAFERLRWEGRGLSADGDKSGAKKVEALVNWDNERRGAAPTFASEIEKVDIFPTSPVRFLSSDQSEEKMSGSEPAGLVLDAHLAPPRSLHVTVYGMADQDKKRLWVVFADTTGRSWERRKHRRYVECLQELTTRSSVALSGRSREFSKRFEAWLSGQCCIRFSRRGSSFTLDEPVRFLLAPGDYEREVSLRRLETDQVLDKAREQFLT